MVTRVSGIFESGLTAEAVERAVADVTEVANWVVGPLKINGVRYHRDGRPFHDGNCECCNHVAMRLSVERTR